MVDAQPLEQGRPRLSRQGRVAGAHLVGKAQDVTACSLHGIQRASQLLRHLGRGVVVHVGRLSAAGPGAADPTDDAGPFGSAPRRKPPAAGGAGLAGRPPNRFRGQGQVRRPAS